MAVPIIGQPTIHAWFLTVLLRCACGYPVLWVGQPGAKSTCPGCNQKVFQLVGIPTVTAADELAWPLVVEEKRVI